VRTKYHSKKVVYDGQTFDSKKEMARYRDLRLLERAGAISDLQCQVKFVLIPAQREPDSVDYSKSKKGRKVKGKLIEQEVAYYADFVYTDRRTGQVVVEDAKGVRTTEYIIKRKMMLYFHGVRIKEV
jgi:hypothetical protein